MRYECLKTTIMKKVLSKENLDAIKDFIQFELLKRGIIAPTKEIEEVESPNNGKTNGIRFKTEFIRMTTNVFDKGVIHSRLTFVMKKHKPKLVKGYEPTWFYVSMRIYCTCRDFHGEDTSTRLFDISFEVFGNEHEKVRVSKVE